LGTQAKAGPTPAIAILEDRRHSQSGLSSYGNAIHDPNSATLAASNPDSMPARAWSSTRTLLHMPTPVPGVPTSVPPEVIMNPYQKSLPVKTNN